jgi:hypothetical protein
VTWRKTRGHDPQTATDHACTVEAMIYPNGKIYVERALWTINKDNQGTAKCLNAKA